MMIDGVSRAPTDRATYAYDALDRLAREVEDHAGGGKDRTTVFTYQGLTGLVTQEEQTGGTEPKTKTYSYDAYGHRIAMTDKVTGSTAAPQVFTYAHDVHGSTSQLLTDAGAVKAGPSPFSVTPRICGMISPAFSSSTRSPWPSPSRATLSQLWTDARATVVPDSSTGSSRATGVTAPVRPT